MNQHGNNQGNNPSNNIATPPESTIEPATQPTKSAPLPPTIPPHEPHESKHGAIFIAVCVVVLLAFIGGLVYVLTKEYPPDESPSASTATVSEEDGSETISAAQRVVNELKTKAVGEQQRIDAMTEHGGIGPTDGVVYTTAAYRFGNYAFAVYPATPYGFGTTSTAKVAADDEAAIRSYLAVDDFTETPEGSDIFVSENAVCAVRLFGDGTEKTLNGISVGCGDLSDYDKNYQEALPFYTAYVASKPESAQNLLLASPVIKDGADDYENAYVSIGSSLPGSTDGFTGLFYRTPASDEWTFFIGTQSDLDCALFSTVTLKKAFDGRRCINVTTGEESMVKS